MVPGSIPGGRIALLSSSWHLHRQRFNCAVCEPQYLACPYRCLQRALEGSTLENAGRDDLGGFSTPILLNCSCSKKRSKSSRPPFSQCWTPVQQKIAKRLDVAWAQAIPAIAQLVEHLTVDCAEIRWSLARFRAAGLLCSHPPGTSTGSVSTVLFVSLSILPVHTAVWEGLGGQYFGKCGAG